RQGPVTKRSIDPLVVELERQRVDHVADEAMTHVETGIATLRTKSTCKARRITWEHAFTCLRIEWIWRVVDGVTYRIRRLKRALPPARLAARQVLRNSKLSRVIGRVTQREVQVRLEERCVHRAVEEVTRRIKRVDDVVCAGNSVNTRDAGHVAID